MQELDRQAALVDRVPQGQEDFGVRLAALHGAERRGVEARVPGVEVSETAGGRLVPFVGHIVGQPREGVDRGDVRTHPRRQEPGRDRKILVM